MGEPGLHTVKQVVAGRIIRPVQGMLKGHLIGRTVALENQATQAQQGGTVVAPMVHPIFKRL
jgi:hypothetical protein